MDEWMNELKDERMDEWMNEGMNEYISNNAWTYVTKQKQTNKEIRKCMNK